MTNTASTKTVPFPAQPREAGTFIKHIGHTTYRVGVYFSGTNTETARDKILRLVKYEAENKAAVKQ